MGRAYRLFPLFYTLTKILFLSMLSHQKLTQKKYQSLSDLEKIQTNDSKYQDSVRPKYQKRRWINEYQYQLYRIAILGLKAYSKSELCKMSIDVKRKISKFYKKVQIILNRWKQQLMNEMFEQLCLIKYNKFSYNPFQKVFNDTIFGVQAFGKTTDDAFECTLTFTQLDISREQIIYKLIQEKVFPTNFYKLQKS